MRKRFEESLLHVANWLELFISILMIIMLIILSLKFFVIIIEVLLFATARQMIVFHLSAVDTLIGVAAIAGLFATRKYLFCAFDGTSTAIFRATQRSKAINWLFRIQIPEEDGATLGEVVINKLNEEEKEIATGSCVYYSNFALRIAKMHGDVITRVEVIKSI